MTGPVNLLLGLTWTEYAATSEPWIHFMIKVNGLFFLLCAILCLTVKPSAWLQKTVLSLGLALIGFYLITRTMSDFGRVGMAMEHALQLTAPLWLLLCLPAGKMGPRTIIGLKLAIAFTFVGHGLYAIGYYPVPASYQVMLAWLPGIEVENTVLLLELAALLDFAVAFAIFMPERRVQIAALSWAVCWGLLTALARTVTHITRAEDYYGLIPWCFETLVRTSHWLLPLLLLLLVLRQIGGAKGRSESIENSNRTHNPFRASI